MRTRVLSFRERFRDPVREGDPGDFTTTFRILPIALLACIVGVIGALLAWVLLRLIAVFTNAFFYQRLSDSNVGPADAHIGLWVLLVPAIGGLIVGFMARYGSDRIRGHGIPEAIEAILMNGSKVQPRVANLKPLSSAIAIGSGGPFGAEGPIIVTGGAFGSITSQVLHLSASERKTLLVAGAASGMSATFGAPVAAVMLAVELLLFEWKPRSLIPVAVASATAATVRHWLLAPAPLFPTPPHTEFIGAWGMVSCLIIGLSAGVLSTVLTAAVYAGEDAFHRLPVHWMWWPAIGGVAVGICGLIFPEALGVGYNNIELLLSGDAPTRIIIGVLLVKSVMWAIALSSGTSGGILAPLLMMGAAMGAAESHFLPGGDPALWPLIAMGAILGGTMRAPLTGVVFSLELTHDTNIMLPLLAAVMVAHGFTVLTLRRSILTEKLSRRGHHLAYEYAVDVLDGMLVRQGMRTDLVAIPADATLAQISRLDMPDLYESQPAYPIIGEDSRLLGVISAGDLSRLLINRDGDLAAATVRFGDIATESALTVSQDVTMREAADALGSSGRSAIAVTSDDGRLVGMVTVKELLAARRSAFELDWRQERVLTLRLPFFRAPGSADGAAGAVR
ncbi:MAG: chloride channel protein [Dehalococcoidia bacterium]|nr:chloride channel protein [Dehalococcoidia bacterium]